MSAPRGVSGPKGGPLWGVSGPGGMSASGLMGVSAPGGCLPLVPGTRGCLPLVPVGVYPSMQWGRHPLPLDRQTPMKT